MPGTMIPKTERAAAGSFLFDPETGDINPLKIVMPGRINRLGRYSHIQDRKPRKTKTMAKKTKRRSKKAGKRRKAHSMASAPKATRRKKRRATAAPKAVRRKLAKRRSTKKAPHMVKGSAAAKAHMAKIRGMSKKRGKRKASKRRATPHVSSVPVKRTQSSHAPKKTRKKARRKASRKASSMFSRKAFFELGF